MEARYWTDTYGVHRALPVNKQVDREARRGEPDEGVAFYSARQVELASASDERDAPRCGDAGESVCAGLSATISMPSNIARRAAGILKIECAPAKYPLMRGFLEDFKLINLVE